MQERSHNKAPSSAKRADKSGKLFPIVGIGASAGGLAAFTRLLEHLPSDTGMAFVLVQHLAPTHESLLSELISRVTAMPVSEVKDGMQVEPNHVYVIPPDTAMSISHGVLKLTPRDQTHGFYLPIDHFLRSLAEDDGGMALGVVLSGTGSDGAEGLRAIKEHDGITFAQDPDSAEQDGMPKSAIATGAADFVMTPQEIAQELARLAVFPYMRKPREAKAGELAPELEAGSLNRIFTIVHAATGADFSQYKQATIKRRIARRMALLKIEKLPGYVTYLRENPAEAQILHQDILIKVTEFFRDPGAFETLKREVFPQILQNISPEAPIRVWVPGCATGEEAYSIAITLLEFLGNTASKHPIQIFATDINGVELERARIGTYLERIKREVSGERLGRFFERVKGGYRIIKMVREMVIFAKHDVTKDPPFSRLELISFRNVLIYMQPALQARLIPMFHYALNPGGFLMLSPAETVGGFTDLFAETDSKHKIYSRKGVAAKLPLGFTAPTFRAEKVSSAPIEAAHAEYDPLKEANQLILESYAPAGFLINSALVILQFYGNTRLYLEPSIGKASLNLAKMIQKGLAPVLRTAVNDAKKTGSVVRRAGLRLTYNAHYKTVDLEVVPMKDPADELYFVILFKDSCPLAPVSEDTPPGGVEAGTKRGSKDAEIAQLRRELVSTEDHLQSIIQEKDGAYEELQSTSEELQSSNEEMQSINEELETSKEELQSTNEELATVNQELENRNAELAQTLARAEDARDYAQGIVETVREPLVVLGRNLRVRTASHSFYEIFKVTPEETEGKLIFDLGSGQWDIPRLRQLLEQIIPEKFQLEGFEVEHAFPVIGYKTMLLNARMIQQEAHEPLILLAIEDITERKRAEDALRDSEERYRSLFENMLDGYTYCKMIFDDSGRPIDFIYLSVNSVFEKLTGLENVTGRRITEIIPGVRETEPELFDIYGRVSLTGKPEKFEIDFKPLGLWFSISVYSTQREHFVAVFDNITERKRVESVVQARLRMMVAAADLSLDDTLQMALDEIEAQTGSTIGFYHFLQDDQETLLLQNWSTNTVQNMCTADGKGSHYPVSGAGVWADPIRERRPIIHNDYASLPHRKGMPEGHAPVIREMIVPILRGDRIVAIIGMGNKPIDYNATDVEIASLLGDFSWEIVERKRVEEALAESKRLSDVLNTINVSISSTLDFNEIMQKVVVEATKAMGCSMSSIEMRKDCYWEVRYLYGLPEKMLGMRFSFNETKDLEIIVKTKKPFVMGGDDVHKILDPRLIDAFKVKSMLLMPIIVKDEVVAGMRFVYQEAPAALTADQVDFATKLASVIALALENARLYEGQRHIADTLQEALLTVPQRIEGIKFNHLYRSAAEAALVGGDFYDLFELDHKKIGIVIGDVAGKGIKAASLTSQVKNTIRAFSFEDPSPASIMAKTNVMVFESTTPSDFVTVFFGILETSTGKLTYCDAGHPPAIISRGDRSVDLLTDYSPVIGAFPDRSYADSEINLGRGDTLILYTDGIIEARCEGGFYGEERLVAFIKELEPVSAELLPQQIFDEVVSCTGGKLSDDTAILTISLEGNTFISS